jgi:hypothetical protein
MSVGGLWAAGLDPSGARFTKQGRDAVEVLLAFQEWSGAFAYIRQPGQEEVRLLATTDALGALAPRVAGQLSCRKPGLSLLYRQ